MHFVTWLASHVLISEDVYVRRNDTCFDATLSLASMRLNALKYNIRV